MKSSLRPGTNFRLKIKRLASTIYKAKFNALETTRALLFPAPRFRILFSVDKNFEKTVRSGFRLLHHQIQFDVFTPENINKNDLLIPLTIGDVREIAKFPHLIKNRLIPIPNLEAANICDDKYLFVQTMIGKGFGHLIPKIGDDLPLPFILKTKVGIASKDCYLILNAEQKFEYKELINSPDYFCQEVIQGVDEYCAHILFKDHKIVTSLTIKYNYLNGFPYNIKRDHKLYYKSICKNPHLDTFASILDTIGYEGICNFNYKILNGEPKIFEVNPRFGNSLCRYFVAFLRHLN